MEPSAKSGRTLKCAAPASLPQGCIAENTLGELVEGRLGEPKVADVNAHLAQCSDCRALVETAQQSSAGDRASDGTRLDAGARVGRYVILELVGAGAMGAVYAAHDPDLDRRVALKLLRPGSCDEELRARLLREAKAMARLSHAHVITVHDVGTYGAQLFVAMELVGGGTLRAWLARERRSWRETLDVVVRAGRGLACAHDAGLVHRDFKPDNVLVGADGRVRVTDFGLARAVREDALERAAAEAPRQDALDATLTRTGTLVGTPAYMAPEQLAGEPADARADMFGFSVALYEALYGERPFDGATVMALRASTRSGSVRPAPTGSEVPSRVRRTLLIGLRPRPDDRFASMTEFLDALEGAARPLWSAAFRRDPRAMRSRANGLANTTPPKASPKKMGVSSLEAMADALLPLVAEEPRRPRRARTRVRVVTGFAIALVGIPCALLASQVRGRVQAPEADPSLQTRAASPDVPSWKPTEAAISPASSATLDRARVAPHPPAVAPPLASARARSTRQAAKAQLAVVAAPPPTSHVDEAPVAPPLDERTPAVSSRQAHDSSPPADMRLGGRATHDRE
jgi:serine/threonine protein kinase